jgi:hypothetical protein
MKSAKQNLHFPFSVKPYIEGSLRQTGFVFIAQTIVFSHNFQNITSAVFFLFSDTKPILSHISYMASKKKLTRA